MTTGLRNESSHAQGARVQGESPTETRQQAKPPKLARRNLSRQSLCGAKELLESSKPNRDQACTLPVKQTETLPAAGPGQTKSRKSSSSCGSSRQASGCASSSRRPAALALMTYASDLTCHGQQSKRTLPGEDDHALPAAAAEENLKQTKMLTSSRRLRGGPSRRPEGARRQQKRTSKEETSVLSDELLTSS